jgi:hypothetical protein
MYIGRFDPTMSANINFYFQQLKDFPRSSAARLLVQVLPFSFGLGCLTLRAGRRVICDQRYSMSILSRLHHHLTAPATTVTLQLASSTP